MPYAFVFPTKKCLVCVCLETLQCLFHILSSFQVWGIVSSEDFQVTWVVEWASIARWEAAITIHFKISFPPHSFSTT